MTNYVDTFGNAFFVFALETQKIQYCNEKARSFYDISTETTDLEPIFQKNGQTFLEMVTTELEEKHLFVCNNIITTTPNGESQVADIQIAFFDSKKTLVCIEIIPKEDVRMNTAREQVNHAPRPEGIFNFDANFTLVHCNKFLYDVFETNEEMAKLQYHYEFSSVFHPDVREDLRREIHENLKNSDHFLTKLKVLSSTGAETWYSLEFQKRTLDTSGQEKVIVSMTNIESQVKMEEELNDISQYFNTLEGMTNGIIYRFDTKTRTLHRSPETARLYNMPRKSENFPSQEWLHNMMHPEDIEGFTVFMDQVANGISGSYKARFRTTTGALEYHLFTFKPILTSNGSVKEMVGCANNIQDKYELETSAKNVKKQFDILERVCEDKLSFIDFKSRVIVHNESHAADLGIEVVEGHFPDAIMSRVHPEDSEEFKKFTDSNLKGVEGTLLFRMKVNQTDFEWFEVTSFMVNDEAGKPEQIVARIKNVHTVQELQSKVADFNKQFDIIEKITQETMIQVDIKTRILVHRGNHAAQIGVNNVEENFPDCVFPRVYAEDLENFKKYTESLLNGKEGNLTFRMKVVDKETEYEWFQLDCYLIYDKNGQAEQIVGTVKNVQSHLEMIKRANTDMLTGCLNKMATLEQVEEILQKSSANDKHALFFLDLDDFKYVNDNLGHAFGDYLLKDLGRRLSENIRSVDLLGRVGGDEFVIFMQNISNEEVLMGKGKIILSSISEDFVNGENKHNINGSIGISLYPDHGTTYEELYHHADLALYHSKEKGKNTTNLYHNDLKHKK